MQSSFAASFAFTRAQEGGLSLDARDPGCYVSGRARNGELIGSKCGISAATLAHWVAPEPVTPAMMRDLPETTIAAIYQTLFWQPVRGDALPAGIDLMVMDFAFNVGLGPAGRVLQQCLGLSPADQDGWIGPLTLADIMSVQIIDRLVPLLDAPAVHGLQQALGVNPDGIIGAATKAALEAQPSPAMLVLIGAAAAKQASHYRQAANFMVFGRDWLSRTHARQMAACKLAMAHS